MAPLDSHVDAERLALIIKRFWARQHETVKIYTSPEWAVRRDGERISVHEIRSDMINGYPAAYKAPLVPA